MLSTSNLCLMRSGIGEGVWRNLKGAGAMESARFIYKEVGESATVTGL